MLIILTAINISMSIMFMMMMHPLSMGLILLIQTTLISLMTGNMNSNFWFSYVLFLIMIGGMLILFMYMTSIASNEKFKLNMYIFTIIPMVTILTYAIYPNDYFIKNNEMIETGNHSNMLMTMNKFINLPLSGIMLFMMIYLLLALIATVKITNFKQGSIRQMN